MPNWAELAEIEQAVVDTLAEVLRMGRTIEGDKPPEMVAYETARMRLSVFRAKAAQGIETAAADETA